MTLPDPPQGESRQLLQAIWDMTFQTGQWPTFAQLDRRWDSSHDTDVADVLRQLPEGFANGFDPRSQPQGNTRICLTVAGAAACDGAQETLSVFLDFIRVATGVEKGWEPPPDSPDATPSLTDQEYVSQAHGLPAAGRVLLLQLLFELLHTESSVWTGLNGPDADGHWQASFNRRIRVYRNVTDLDAYWTRRYKSWEPDPEPQTRAASQTADGDDAPTAVLSARPRGERGRRRLRTTDSEAKPMARAPASPAPGQLDADKGTLAVPTDKRIFLSHASADKALADLLRNALVLGGLAEERIFYSSGRGTGIPSGEDVGTYLRRSLQDAGLVIELLSKTFLTRPMCLMELGGAWTLGTPTYPIVVPPLTREEAATQIGNIQMGVLNTDTEISEIFDELHDRIAQHLGIQTKLTAWNRAIRDFKQQLPPKLAAAQSAAAAQSSSPKVNAAIATAGTEDDKITIGNISLTAGARGKELHAEATNHDAIEHSAIIKATFYEAEGGIIGTSDATVQQLVAGRTKTFSMHDLPHSYARVNVAVDLIV
jgi:hypothetical protein